MLGSKPSNSRRILLPIMILIMGGAVAIWASRQETQKLDEIRELVTDLCQDSARGLDLTSRLPTADGLINRGLNSALEAVCRGLDQDAQLLEVIVASGDGPDFSDGAATHHALVSIGGVDRLGLRIACAEDRILIIGYWRPIGAAGG